MHDSVRKTRYLTEAAAAAAISALLVLLKLLAPFLVFVTMIASPAPIALICAFHGMRWGCGTAAAVIFLVNILGGLEIGFTTAFYAAALGLAMGYGFRRRWSYGRTLHLTAAAYLLEMTYKVTFSVYILGIADAFSSILNRLVSFARWVWMPLSSFFGFDPDPEKSAFTAAGGILVAVLFVLHAYGFSYFNQEIGRALWKRLCGVRRN